MKKIMLKVEDNVVQDYYYEEQQEYTIRLTGYELYTFDETKVSADKVDVGLTLEEMNAELVEE